MTDLDLSVLETQPINAWPFPRVLVCIPLERAVSHADHVFFRFMEIAMQGPAMLDIKYGRIDVVRNVAATQLLASDYTHLLMLDIDHKHPVDIIQQFAKWALIYPDKEVISGLNFRRSKPFDPVAGLYDEGTGKRQTMTGWPQGLVQVDEVGGASLFVARSVFEKLEPPWFFNIYDEIMENSYPGEDIGFSRKCKEAGIPVFVDTTITSPHCTDVLVTEETFRAYMEHRNEAG